MAGCCENIFRTLLFFFNLILFAAGIGLIVVGGLAAKEFKEYADEKLFDDKYLWAPVAIAIVLGILLLLLGIFGLGGLCLCKRKCMIKAYVACLIIFIALELAVAIVAATNKDELKDSAQKSIKSLLKAAYNGTATKTKKAIDDLQKEFDCCGGFGIADYTSQRLHPADTCCVHITTGCGRNNQTALHQKGCGKALEDKFKEHSDAMIGIAVTFAVLQIVAFIFACKMLRDDDGTYV